MLTQEERRIIPHISVYLFVIIPFAALVAAIPVAAGWGLTWLDAALAASFYFITYLGASVGFHRYFTHGSFKARRPVRIALAVAGSMAVHGPIINWVATHRRHHQYTDREGDPHSPWLYGSSVVGLARGIFHSHVGWLLERQVTNHRRFAPDLLADRDIQVMQKLFGPLTVTTVLLPPLIGGLLTWSWWGALTAFFWASVVRIAFVHHVGWSVNSLCHLVGPRPYASRDRSTNFWPLALLSMGDAWHNLHHADPTCARHGVGRGELDISARVIWILEKLRLVYDVRWPDPVRIARLTLNAPDGVG